MQMPENPISQPRWLTDDQQRAWRALWEVYGRLDAQLDKDLRAAHGLSLSEYGVLVRLSEAPDWAARMAQLAESSGISRSRLTHIVTRMEQRGLLERCSAVGDGRGITCRMTQAGYELLVAAAPVHVASVREHLIDLLDDGDIAALEKAMTKLRDHLVEQN